MRVDYSGSASSAAGDGPVRLLIASRRALPGWWSAVVDEIERLSLLPDNWDQRGAVRVNPHDILDALTFLDRVMADDTSTPRFAPLNSGGVELLWRGEDLEVEAVFDCRRDDRSLLVEVGEQEWETEIDAADSLFLSIRDRLSSQHAQPA